MNCRLEGWPVCPEDQGWSQVLASQQLSRGCPRKALPWGNSNIKEALLSLACLPSRDVGVPLAHGLPIAQSRKLSKISTWSWSLRTPKSF